jgi:hypothetical protein
MNATEQQAEDEEAAHNTMMARGRLKAARKLFEHRGWKELPQGVRGQRVIAWGAVMAWLAAETDQKRELSVRRWIRCWWPRIKDAELDQIVADTVVANKRWSNDECAIVLEVGVLDRPISLQFIGADNDHHYEIRNGIRRAKAAARARKCRAARSTGRPPGRPALQLAEEDRIARRRAQDAERKRAKQAAECSGRPRGRPKSENASAKTPSRHLSNNIGSVTELKRTDFSVTETSDSRAPQGVPALGTDESGWIWVTDMDGTVIQVPAQDDDDPDDAPFALATGAARSQDGNHKSAVQ